jgi:hypothetical protein
MNVLFGSVLRWKPDTHLVHVFFYVNGHSISVKHVGGFATSTAERRIPKAAQFTFNA